MKTDNMMSGGERIDMDQEEKSVDECDGEGRAHVTWVTWRVVV